MNPVSEATPNFSDLSPDSTTNQTTADLTPVEWNLSPGQVASRATLLLIICALGVTSNALNGLMLFKCKRPSTTMHILMFNLVVVDMLMSATCIPLSILFCISNGSINVPNKLCKVAAYLFQSLIIASLYTQSAISVIRTAAITYPEQLQQRLPPSTAYKIVICIWLQATITPLLPFLSHDYIYEDLFTYNPHYVAYVVSDEHTGAPQAVIFSIVGHLLPLAVICISYITLYVSLRRHLKRNFLVHDRHSRNMYAIQMRVHVKVGCLVVFVVSSTALIWIPFYIMSCISFFEEQHLINIGRNTSNMLIFAASSVNPIMYGFMNASLRQEFKSYLSIKHPKLVARLRRVRCCRCICNRRAKVEAVIVIPEKMVQASERLNVENTRPGSISGQLVLQINQEISLKQQSVLSTRHQTDPRDSQQLRETMTGVSGDVPPLIKRYSWSQSLAQNARRFSDKVSRRRSGSDGNLVDGRQLPLLDFKTVSQFCEDGYQNTVGMFPKTERELNPVEQAEDQPDTNITKYQAISVDPLAPKTKHASTGHRDGSVVAVSKCFKTKPVFGDIVKVRRVFVEEVTLVPGFKGPASDEMGRGVGASGLHSCHRESLTSVDSQLLSKTTVKTSGDVYSTLTVQLPGCI